MTLRCRLLGHKFFKRKYLWDGTIVTTSGTVDSGPLNDRDRQQCVRCGEWIPTGDPPPRPAA